MAVKENNTTNPFRSATANPVTFASQILDEAKNLRQGDINQQLDQALQEALTTLQKKADLDESGKIPATQLPAIAKFTKSVVAELPGTGSDNVIYFVPAADSEEQNVYEEYMWIDGQWELLGTTKVDLSGYATKEEMNKKVILLNTIEPGKATMTPKEVYDHVKAHGFDALIVVNVDGIRDHICYRVSISASSITLDCAEFYETNETDSPTTDIMHSRVTISSTGAVSSTEVVIAVNLLKKDAVTEQMGESTEHVVCQKLFTDTVNEINNVLFTQYTALTFSRTPSVIERGINTKVTLTWNPTFNGAYAKPSALTAKKGATTLTTDTSLKTIQDTEGITETTTYSIEATIKGIKKTASATVNAYYPMYFGGSASEEITSEELLALTKQSIKSSPAGQVTIPLTTGQYLWLCVPESMSINSVGILNSAPVGMEQYTVVAVSGKGNYRCYRSESAMIRDTSDTYVIG